MSLSREEIIRMAVEASEGSLWKPGMGNEHVAKYLERLVNIAYAAGAVAEREACAEIVDNWETPDCGGWHAGGIVDAIRARSSP